ncbi:MAG: hypothetical protein L3J37_04740 [Rhodobacteraceae bacterium]|nr:hypothetical protein [Paracoccaceae bacterium]
MKISDIGGLDGPVLLFGGAYGNLQALKAVLAMAGKPGAVMVSTGDTFAYCVARAATAFSLGGVFPAPVP